MSLLMNPRVALYAQFAAAALEGQIASNTTVVPSQAVNNAWHTAQLMMNEMPGELKAQMANDIMAHESLLSLVHALEEAENAV